MTLRRLMRIGARRRDLVGASAPVLVGLALMPLVIAAGFWAERSAAPSPALIFALRPSFDPSGPARP